ncbi:MAG: CHC2 zinc finger domain-containing protein [Eubacterium sp.]
MTTKEQADLIKAQITMAEVLQAYGFNWGASHGRIPCPIHGGKHKNFSFNDFGFKCFVCGAHGGQVGFVEQYLEIPFEAALEDINRHFNLWSDSREISFIEKRQIKDAAQKRRFEQLKKEHEAMKVYDAIDELNRLDANRLQFAPKSEQDEWHPEYIEALKKIETQRYIVGEM